MWWKKKKAKAVSIVSEGEIRTVTILLEPGEYRIEGTNTGASITRRVFADVDEYYSVGHGWIRRTPKLDTLRVPPTWWERVKAFFTRREPIPRAITIATKHTNMTQTK